MAFYSPGVTSLLMNNKKYLHELIPVFFLHVDCSNKVLVVVLLQCCSDTLPELSALWVSPVPDSFGSAVVRRLLGNQNTRDSLFCLR